MSSLYNFAVKKYKDHNNLCLLDDCDIKTPKLTYEGHIVKAKCVKVYDGDTPTFVFVPPGMKTPYKFPCRCLGYNSAEIKTKNPSEKRKAEAARDYLSNRILNRIVDLELGKHDKYGRILVNIYVDNTNINQEMITMKHGAPYDGTGPKLY